MKPKFLAYPNGLLFMSSIMLAVMTPLSASAATFTWDGGDATSNSWTAANNWDPDGAPTLDNTADVVFNTLTRPSGFITNNIVVRSLAFGADVDGALTVRLLGFPTGPQVARNLTFDTDVEAGDATILVDADATGDITIGRLTSDTANTTGTTILADNLVVNHNGSGLLLINRGMSGTGFGLTKNGTGSLQTDSFNSFTGPININEGTLIANTFGSAGQDLNAASAINLGGGTLEIRASSGTNKTYANVPLNVNAASTLTYNNVNAGTFTAQFTDTVTPSPAVVPFVINADLTVKNTSANISAVNAFNIARAITGTGDILVETFNDITSSSDNFSLGRIFLNANNSAWSGDLKIAKGTVSLGGNAVNAAGTGEITLGTTSDPFGAGLTFFPGGGAGSTVSYANDITVTGGTGSGFRAIKGGNTNHSVTFSGSITLEGNLTLDHTWSSADRRITLNGPISGDGGLTITRAAGNSETTAVLGGQSTYTGPTTVTNGASLSLSSSCSLTSDITVEGGARIGGAGSTTGTLTLENGANYFFFFSATYAPMKVSGAVTLDNSFGVASLVGGSRGEVVPWADVAPGIYTLIGGTSSTFNNIQNLGAGNAVVDVGGVSGKNAYFQNGGGTGSGGLQLVVTGPSGFDSWKTANSATGGLSQDHDGDGVDNGAEYFLKGNLDSTGFTQLPGITANSITWTAASIEGGYAGVYGQHFTVETSDTLEAGSWVTAPLGTGADTVTIPFAARTATRNVKYTFPTSGPKKFARLRITGP